MTMLNYTVAQSSTALNYMLTTSLLGSRLMIFLFIVNHTQIQNVVLQDITSVQMKAVLKINSLAVTMSMRDIVPPRTTHVSYQKNVVHLDYTGAH